MHEAVANGADLIETIRSFLDQLASSTVGLTATSPEEASPLSSDDTPEKKPRMLFSREAADYLGITPRQLRNYAKTWQIKSKVKRGRYRFWTYWLDEFKADLERPDEPDTEGVG